MYSSKQARGVQHTESDQSDLIYAYFDHCSSVYKMKFEQQEVSIKLRLVTYPGECKQTDIDKFINNIVSNTKNAREILKIIGYVVSSIGLLGNLLSLSVFCRPSFIAAYHISFYCIARSCYDILMLVFCILCNYNARLEFSSATSSDEDNYNSVPNIQYVIILQCAFVFAGFMTSEIGTALSTLAISIERLISISIPLKAKVYLTHRVARRVTFGVVCISISIPLGFFLYTYLQNDITFGKDCLKFSRDPSSTEFLYFTIIWMVIVILIPWFLILGVTVVTVKKLRAAAKKRQTMTSQNSSQNDPHKRTKTMSLVIAFSFIVALVPEIIGNAFAILQAINLSNFYELVHLNDVITLMLAVKSSLGFFLCVTSNDEFRQVIIGYCKLCLRCKRICTTAQ